MESLFPFEFSGINYLQIAFLLQNQSECVGEYVGVRAWVDLYIAWSVMPKITIEPRIFLKKYLIH